MRYRHIVHDRQSQTTIRVTDPLRTFVQATTPKISPDGRYFAYAEQRWPFDIWLYDHEVGESEELLPGAGFVFWSVFSRDGRYLVTLGSETDNQGRALTSLIRRDLASGIDERRVLRIASGLDPREHRPR